MAETETRRRTYFRLIPGDRPIAGIPDAHNCPHTRVGFVDITDGLRLDYCLTCYVIVEFLPGICPICAAAAT